MKVWVVEEGEYSDARPTCAFSSYEKAWDYARPQNHSNGVYIYEFELDAELPASPPDWIGMVAQIMFNMDTGAIVESNASPRRYSSWDRDYKSDPYWFRRWPVGRGNPNLAVYNTRVTAPNPEHAIKVAMDRVAILRADPAFTFEKALGEK